ncbi:TPA: hypothetical protein N0F65_001390 [Lagenidium giganteum]|uniref:PX domain-containing protein n=1 Tax=Lagenidium giganteum TaxID=4803 RepID=A0AAV2YWY0_9STRA|nr:TPA: hypothetical protein N0F65_001390 [Lagenidium giganteum]
MWKKSAAALAAESLHHRLQKPSRRGALVGGSRLGVDLSTLMNMVTKQSSNGDGRDSDENEENRPQGAVLDDRGQLCRVSMDSTCSTRSSMSTQGTRRRFGTILLDNDRQDLFLFRDEAEYSDYLNATITGVHTEMDSVVFYEVEVSLSQMKWKVLRRFSEFRNLRQVLIKHISRRLRFQNPKCQICVDILESIQQHDFPSKRQRQQLKKLLFASIPPLSFSTNRETLLSVSDASGDEESAKLVADRKAKFQEFLALCLLTIRGLRQHAKIMKDSTSCQTSICLRAIEEFLGLSFTRYLRFLGERGIVKSREPKEVYEENTKYHYHHYHHHHAHLHASHGKRRATIAG